MAAYAAVVSLMNTIHNIQDHPIHSFCLDKNQIQSLLNILDFLLDFIESYNCRRGSREDEVLESRIASAAHEAEDVIESHVIDRILAGCSTADHGGTSWSFLMDLEAVIKDMNSVKETVMEFQETEEFTHLKPPSCSAPSTSSHEKNVMVGFDDELIRIMDRLTGPQPDLQVIPIVGMGGIGKTTLANNVYENLVIVEHFDIRAYATISQEYSVKNILVEINKSLGGFYCETVDQLGSDPETVDQLGSDPETVDQLGSDPETMDQLGLDPETVDQLGLKLYQSLYGRRYLIVLDDIWSIDVWDKIKFFFPNNDCRSRIVITTRISDVATYLSSSSFEMKFLDDDKSWELFCGTAFQEEGCPPELEEIGKKIVRNCKGLPLSISVIGGLLRNSRRLEYWESVARETNSILMLGKDEICLNIVLMSYNHLPAYIKPCFLYMGFFRDNHAIYVNQLIELFVGEGFLKPNKAQSLEEIAVDYLTDLVNRNLILVESWRWKGTIKYLRMHDLVKEVCLRIAEKEKFCYKIRVIDNPPDISRERRVVFYHRVHLKKDWPQFYNALPASLARTFKCDGVPLPFKCQLLRVLSSVEFESMEAIFQLVNLRYLSCKPFRIFNPFELRTKVPSSISLLWNLQTLILNGRVDAPVEIWHMRKLRHLQVLELFLPDPPPSDQEDDLLKNLQTLTKVMNFRFDEEACRRIPNITKLRIRYDDFVVECKEKSYYYLNSIVNLLKLESLRCSFSGQPKRDDLLQSLVFPRLLRKLSLWNCQLHWEDLETYGFSLPHLEVLKLNNGAVTGPEWDCVEGAFPSLRFLKICDSDLKKWNAEDYDFPKLEKLHLQNQMKLEKIPSGLGDVQTLRFLQLYQCSSSATISASVILEEQRSLGNDYLQVITRMTKVWMDEFVNPWISHTHYF